jgi:hypothetical protein
LINTWVSSGDSPVTWAKEAARGALAVATCHRWRGSPAVALVAEGEAS